ncbi:amino acid permease [Nocardioides daphniae]|uniref:Amino acid permease n=1 Tax=Nocardioides daphniae TaxID=402297 RepID=A0A4P7UDV4_9ACTN|nr:amino acid permease [Nocardioides daphniae]QCC77109.1 amino acid permease [Nocardioides daphniae]GGD19719.1 amino acid permease [Nocardioides daphniae]
MSLFRTKSVEQSIAETDEPEHRLNKSLSALDLTIFGVGVIVGAGIFVYTGTVAAQNSGPAISLSFVIAGLACALAALCYAEFASTLPVAGSAYTFSYATFGEFVAWLIGWDLVLEFTVGGAALASSFSGYLQSLLEGTPFEVPAALGSSTDGVVNLPAVVIAVIVTLVLARGIKLASIVNQVVTAIKLVVVALVIVMGVSYVKVANWTPFVPESRSVPAGDASFWSSPLVTSLFGLEPAVYGWAGVMAGAAVVFFAFLGFDVVATVAEETKDPQRDVPRGILASLAIVTALYVMVSLVITGMQNYADIDPDDSAPLATAFEVVGQDWVSTLIGVGATIGLTVVTMTLVMGQTRVGFAMARDGLLPGWLAKVHPEYRTPSRITLLCGTGVALLAGFVDFATLGHLVSIGTLFAFVLVAVGVMILRRTRPDLDRGFRVPAVNLLAPLSVLLSVYLMLNLVGETWVRFLAWMVLGVVVYFAYSRRNSRLGQRLAADTAPTQAPTA